MKETRDYFKRKWIIKHWLEKNQKRFKEVSEPMMIQLN